MNSRRLMLAPLMTEHRTGKNYRAGRGDVRFGSLADKPFRAKIHLCPLLSKSGQTLVRPLCPLCAKSGHSV
jgi:hypothetical protein